MPPTLLGDDMPKLLDLLGGKYWLKYVEMEYEFFVSTRNLSNIFY